MTISNKVKTIDNKIEQNKAKYKLDKQTNYQYFHYVIRKC